MKCIVLVAMVMICAIDASAIRNKRAIATDQQVRDLVVKIYYTFDNDLANMGKHFEDNIIFTNEGTTAVGRDTNQNNLNKYLTGVNMLHVMDSGDVHWLNDKEAMIFILGHFSVNDGTPIPFAEVLVINMETKLMSHGMVRKTPTS